MTIDGQTVTRLLRAHLDPDLTALEVTRGSAGNGQETWFVEATDGTGRTRRLVIRRSAAAGTLQHTDRGTEYAVLAALADSGLPVPRVHWLEREPSTLGRPYFVMDRMPGAPPRSLPAGARASVARQIGILLARLHARPLDAAPAQVPRPADAAEATRRDIASWRTRYRDRRPAPVPMIGALLAWLEAHPPRGHAPLALLWGDPGPHNVLVEGERVSALLDWELAHIGHPMEDVGNAVWACLGQYPAEEIVTGYETAAGAPADRSVLNYFTVAGCVTRSIMQIAGVRAYLEEQTDAPNLAGLGLGLVAANLRRAAGCAGWPAVAAPAAPPVPAPDPLRLRPDVAETLAGAARFLRHQVLPATTAPHLVRGLKTVLGLLATAAERAGAEPVVRARLDADRDALLAELAAAGLDTSAGLESVAEAVEIEPRWAPLRDRVRRHLLADLTARAALLNPLRDLYGAALDVPETDQPGRPQ